MKRHTLSAVTAIILSLACALSFLACDGQAPSADTENDSTASETTVSDTEATETEAPETDTSEADTTETDATETDTSEVGATETDATDTDAPEPSVITTVSESEWKKAFDFSAFDSFSIVYTVDARIPATGEAVAAQMAISGTLQYAKGHILTELSKTIDGVSSPESTAFGLMELTALSDMDTFITNNYDKDYGFGMGMTLEYLFAPLDDYGYSAFTYSEESKSYTGELSAEMVTLQIEVFFANGQIERFRYTNEQGSFDMTVSDVNATEVVAPKSDEEIASVVSAAKEAMSTAQSARMVGKVSTIIIGIINSIPVDNDVELSVVNDAFLQTAEKNILSYSVTGGRVSAIRFDARGSEFTFNEMIQPVQYDAITLAFDENGNTVAIIYTENLKYVITY